MTLPGEALGLSWGELHPDTPEPKFYTRRNYSRCTDGWRVAQVAEALGKPLMPWQRYVVDVALEYDEHGYVYEDVLITVPRQSGKTTLVGPVQLDRIIFQKNINVFYTAQTQKDARKRFDDLVTLVQGSPFKSVAKIRLSSGSEHIKFPSGSKLNLFAPNKDAIHGETPPLVTLDEIWALDEELGDAIYDDAIKPAQITLSGNRQRWQISTAGTSQSTYMRKHVKRGRKGAARMAYFEWSLPDGADPYSPESIRAFHPAVGHTITVADVFALAGRDEHGHIDPNIDPEDVMSHAKYLRSICNVWTETSEAVMSADDWAALTKAETGYVPRRDEIAITYELAPDDAAATVMAVWRDPVTDRANLRVLHSAPGTMWVLSLLVRLYKEWKPLVLGADDGGPTRRVTDALRRILDPADTPTSESKVVTTGPRDFNTACDQLLNLAETKELDHDGSKTLAHNMAHLAVKESNGVKSFNRDLSTGPVAGLIAGAVGLWLYDHREQPLGKPELYF